MVKNRKDLTPRRSFSRAKSRARTASANIKVVVRVRPPNTREENENANIVVKTLDDEMLIFDPEQDDLPFFYHGVQQKGRDLLKKSHKNMKFSFDTVFGPDSCNEDIFECSTKDLINSLMDGCNCSVFVYGATGAGKTFTMLGSKEHPGITILTMQELFRQKEELSSERIFELAVSYLEIYNENVQDLLKPGSRALHLREDNKLGVLVPGITVKRIEDAGELFDLLEKGNKNRTQHPTDANAESSRSHAVFQVFIKMTFKNSQQTQIAKLSMIDLAGSERGSATGCKGDRFTEGANINKSLLALGNCINSLADGKRHVPYRDSKLTRVLKDSLGGNCQTVMIANISPSSLSFEDTYNTLKYATRAKKIKAIVKKNVLAGDMTCSQYLKIIEDLQKEIKKLKNQNEENIICNNPSSSQESGIGVSAKSSEMTSKLQLLYEEYKNLIERLFKLKGNKKKVDARIRLKEEMNNRLSGICINTPDKQRGHRKFLQSMERMKNQSDAFQSDILQLEKDVDSIKFQIDTICNENPELNYIAESENMKMEKLITEFNYADLKTISEMHEKECRNHMELMYDMQGLLRPWFILLQESGYATEEMRNNYHRFCNRLQGACSVSFEEIHEETSHVPVVLPNNTETENRTKRKLPPSDLDSTFVKTSPRPDFNNKVGSLPAKRPFKQTYLNLKENKPLKLKQKPTGSMGTSARFTPPKKNILQNVIKPKTTNLLKRPDP